MKSSVTNIKGINVHNEDNVNLKITPWFDEV